MYIAFIIIKYGGINLQSFNIEFKLSHSVNVIKCFQLINSKKSGVFSPACVAHTFAGVNETAAAITMKYKIAGKSICESHLIHLDILTQYLFTFPAHVVGNRW